MKLSNIFGKYTKDWFLTIAVVLVGLIAVSGGGISDYAKTKFWWTFWAILQWVCVIALFIGWLWLRAKDKESRGQ